MRSGVVASLSMVLFACSGGGDDPVLAPGSATTSTTTNGDASTTSDAGGSDAAPTSETFTGEATYYDADGTGACGFGKSTDFLVAALNKVQYTKTECGRCAAVTGPKGNVTVKIVDLCPGCKDGDLDLSQTAFKKIADLSAGRVAITWRFTACP